MIRVIKMSGKWYGINVDITDEDEQDNIKQFVGEGTPVILVRELDDLNDLDIEPGEVEMVS